MGLDDAQDGMAQGGADGGEETVARAPSLPECDECGRVLSMDLCEGHSPLLALMPDSSVADLFNPEHDGERLVIVCTPGCYRKAQHRFRQRPFVQEELWATRIRHALRGHPEGLKPPQLLRDTGLAPAQISAALAWLDRHRHTPVTDRADPT